MTQSGVDVHAFCIIYAWTEFVVYQLSFFMCGSFFCWADYHFGISEPASSGSEFGHRHSEYWSRIKTKNRNIGFVHERVRAGKKEKMERKSVLLMPWSSPEVYPGISWSLWSVNS